MGERIVVCATSDLLEGRRKLVRSSLEGVIGVFNVGGTYRALRNTCPHRGAALCKGTVGGITTMAEEAKTEWLRDGEILRCPWHGWEHDMHNGEVLTEPGKQVKTYNVAVEDGCVVVYA